MTQLKLFKLDFETAGFSGFIQGNNNYGPWKDFTSEQSNRIYYNTFNPPQTEPNLHYFIYRYKLLDIMDPFVGLRDGIFVSQKCLEVLQAKLQLPPHKIYPIHYKKKSTIVSDYYFIYFYFGLRDSIIFEKSLFMSKKYFSVEEEIVCENIRFQDFQDFESKLVSKYLDKDLKILFQKTAFQKSSVTKYDIFPVYLGVESSFYLSQKFIDVFEKEKLTGLDARPFDAFWEE
jgi:hypothetical protein